MFSIHPVPTPYLSLLIPSRANSAAKEPPPRRFPSGDPCAARKAYHAKRAEWSKLDLRQEWADEVFMRDHLKTAGLRVSDSSEPATASRLKSLLRRAGVNGPEIEASVGSDLAGFLDLNPRLPLWAAVALILEATGRFTSEVARPLAEAAA